MSNYADLIERLQRRAAAARSELVATAIGDAIHFEQSADVISRLEREKAALIEVLREGRRAIGDHSAPDDCYATGPVTGNAYRDLIECPACSFIAAYDEALSRTQEQTA